MADEKNTRCTITAKRFNAREGAFLRMISGLSPRFRNFQLSSSSFAQVLHAVLNMQ